MAYNKRQKLSDNIAALRVAFAAAGGQQVSEEHRELLKRFSGFGGLKFILNPCDKEEDKSRWTQSDQPYFDATRELFQLIRDNTKDEAEYLKYVRSVRSSILSAFYTPMPVINAISGALKNAGVEVHTMLDPSSGKGSFVESFLSERPGMEVTAFEKDLLTGKVLQALYPDADVHVDGFETIDKRFGGHFDVAASNIPFGDISVFDSSFTMSDDDVRRHAAKAIHNYFFLKTLDNVREGGIVAFITSQGVMDSPRNKEIRQALMERAYLVGAVRLPNNMFSDEAGTDVGSDLIILQKDSMKQRSYTAFSPEERAFVDNINDLSDSLDDLGFEPEQIEGYRQANPNAYIFCSEYLWDSDSAYLGEHSFGKDQYGKFAIVSHFDGSMEELGKQLQERLDGFMKFEFNKELYQEHALKVQEPVKAVDSHRGSEQAVNDGVKNTSVQQPVKPGVKQKVSQQASAPVQLDFFAIWDEQEEQRLSMEPRSYSGEILSHYRDGVIIIDNDQVGVLSNVGMGTIFKPLTLTEDVLSRLRYYIPVRDAYQQLYAIEAEQHVEQKELREKLNRVYDSFIMRYGSLNDKKNFKAITSDILGKDMLCIENNMDGKFIKSDIFDRPVSFNANELDHVENALDALSASLNRSGGVDLDYMGEISGKSNDELLSELRERIFFNPDNGEYEVRDKFLAGNVIEKIDFFENNYGKEHLETMDDEITRSYHALLEVRPRQIPFAELDFNFGERWMPKEYFEEFASELFDVKVDIQYAANLDEFVVTSEESSEKIRSEFAVHNENGDVTDGLQMLRFALYNTVPTIQKVVGYKPNGDPIKGPDYERMQLAASKIDAIRDAFAEWINGHDQSWKDDLADMYNRKFNCFVRPEYDGTHQTFPDLDFKSLKAKKKIESAYDSQKNAVWMILQNGGGVCDHEVGTGKTLIMCMAAHEMKRLGMAHKPIIIGMKANVSEIAATYQAAYPNGRVLYASEKDYDTAHRVEFFNRAKNNDYDVIIMSHDQFGMIPQSAEIQRDVLEEELYALDEALDVYEQQGYKVSGRMKSGLQKRKENLEAKLREINYTLSRRQDDVVDFKTMGIDHIFVDESQAFKNLPFTTRDSRVAGLGDPEGSKRARNLMYAIRTIQQHTGRDLGATFLSGTTISNSLTELYLLFKYLRPQALAAQDIHSFDAWAAVFATKTRDYEINVAGQVVMKERFRKFIKVPELGAFYNEITDYKTAADVGLERPEMNAKLVNISPTADHNDISKRLLEFANSGNPEYIFRDNLSDNEMQAKMLIVTNLGKKASLSPKLVNEDLYSESDDTKLGVAAKNISEYYEKYKEHRGTQFVFCDLSTPKKGQWTAYQELKDRLVQQYGIPEDEIYFMQDAGSEKKREKIIEKMNRGEIRVLFGSTTTLGTGVNAQERCVAIHHLDLPWRPSDMEQRNGRGVRKGNEVARLYADNKVDVLIYAVERSLDSYNFYLLQAKSDFIRQMKTGALGKRDFDMGSEDEENGMNFQEYVAITSGNTDLLDRAKLEKKVLALEAERKAFNKERSSQEAKLGCNRSDLEKYERYIEHFHKDFETIVGIDKATFSEDPEEVEHAVTSLQSDGYGMDYMYVSQFEFTNKRSVDALATAYGVQKMVNGAEFVVLRGEALGAYLQSLARVEVDGEVMIGSIDRNPVKAWITMESVHQFNSKTGVNSYVGNKFYVKGEELKYTWNEGKVNLREKKEASLYITRAIGRIPGLIDYYQENIISKQKQVQDLEEILKKSWPKADDLSALKKQFQDLDRKIQQEMENDNILNNHGQVAEELPYKIEQKSYGREPWELTFQVKDYPFIGRADRERIEEELHGSIRVYDGMFKGSFRHQYGAEQAIKELSHLNAIHRDDKEFLMSMAKDIYEDACLPSVIRLKEMGFDRHGNPLIGDNARTMKVMTLGDYQDVRALAHGVKDNAESVIYIAAEAMAKAINAMDDKDKDKYILVAMPTSGDRYRTYTDRLCSRLSTLTGLEYANCLEGVEHDSLYDWKKEHPGEKLPELFFSVRGHNRIPEGKTALIIDNVIDTGHTAMAALDAMEHDPVMLVLGATGNHVNYYKNVEVTMVENGMKYVEESLPEGVGLTGKSQQEIDKLLTDARSGEWGSYFEASKNLDRIGIDWYTGQPKYVVHDFVKRWDDADNSTLSEPLKALLEKGSVEALFTEEELGKLTAREKQLMKVCLDFFIGKKDNDYRFDRRQQRQLLIVYDYLKDKVTPKVEIQEVQGDTVEEQQAVALEQHVRDIEADVHAVKKDIVEESASEEFEIITPKDSEERGKLLSAETVKSGDNPHVGFSAVISDGEEQGVEHLVKSVFYDGKIIGSMIADMETGAGNPFRLLRDDAVKETCLLNVFVSVYDSHYDAWEGVADKELDGYYDYGCIRFDNEEDMIRFYEANREELDYRNERYEKIESAYSADGRTSAEVLSIQLPVSYAESLMSINKQRDLDNDEVFIVNHSQEERERLRYVEGEFFEDYLKRNLLDRRDPESLLYFHDKYSEKQWLEIDHIFRAGMTKDNAQKTGEKIAALSYVSSKQEGYSLMGLLRHVQPDAILPYLDGVSAAFNKLGPERSELKKQYDTLKEKHPDALLLFRSGDFYETYEKDAKTASDILGITITWSDNDKAHNLENYEGAMAAFPHHALDTYLPKLVRAGQRVAICDLLEDPKNLVNNVKRDITMLVDRHADVRLQVVGNEEDMKHVLPHDAMLRDALIERLRAAGIPVVIDNVVHTGNTAEACVNALGKGVVLSLASAVSQERHVASLKSLASVVYDKEGKLIPLSERFELKGKYLGRPMMYKPLEKGEIYGLESYDEKEILKYVREHFEMLREQYDFDAEIVDMRVIGSRVVGNHDEDSDLDVLLEYKGKAREDGLFNILNDDEDQLFIDGIPVDINPITEAKSGTIAEFLAHNADYDKAIDKSYKYNKDNNMAKTVLTIEVNGHGSDIYHTMRNVSGGGNAVLADNIRFVGFDDECRVAVSLGGDVTNKEEGLREISFPDERTMALFVQKILGWNHMRSINDTTMLAGSLAYEHLSHVMEGAYELTRVHGQQNAFAEQLLQLWSGDRSSLGDQSIKQFFLEKFRYLNDGEHKAFRDEWNALSAMCNNHLRELAWMSAYVMDDSMIDSLFRVVPSLDKEEQKEGLIINKPMQYAVSYGNWEGVNGLWHVDFGSNINAVSFKEKQSMAAAMGGEARTTYEHEWADFDDKDNAVLFAERVVTANQERLAAHQEQFNKTINGMAPIFAVPANEHVGFRYGTHGVKRDSGNADFDRQMSVFLNQYHRDHKEKGSYIFHYTFGFLFFKQKEALAFAEAYREFAEKNGFKDVYEKLCFITKKQKFFDQVLGGPKPAEFQLVQKRLAEGTYLCETGRDFASEVHYPDDAQKVWLKYAMKQQELLDMVQAAGKEGEIRRLPEAIGEALWYKVENNTIELYETLSDASEGMSPIFPIWKEYKDFENTVDIISRDVRPAAKMHLMDSQAAVMTKQSILNDIYYFTDGNLMQKYTARYISHADDIGELLNREIGGHTLSYYYAESLKHVAEKNGYENFEQLLENFDDLPEVSEEEKEIEDVILEENKELVEKRKVSVPLTDEEYREVSVMGSIIYHMQAAGINVYLDRDLTFAKTTSNERVRQMLNEGGKAYGIVRDDGVIFVDPNVATAETPIHEYTHLWAEVLRQQNPEEWKNIVMMMSDIPLWNEVKDKYPNLYRSDDIAEEVLAHYSGKRGYERLIQSFGLKEGESVSALPEKKRTLFDKISEVVARFWSSVADFLHIHYTSKEQVADQILKDIVNHVNPLDFRKVMPDKIINGLARAHFIGEQGAKNIAKSRMSFLPDMLVQAKRYDAEGMDAVRIKMITGWEKGVDDKWRYEVSNTRVKSMVIDGDTVLSNVIYAPDLFAAYPEMVNIKVRVGGTSERAVYNHETHTITLNDYYRQQETPREEFESVMKKNEGEIKDVEEKIAAGENEAFNKSKLQELENTRAFINGQIASARSINQIWPDINAVFDHETQHIIQDIEGFARGGSLRTVADMRLAEAQKLVDKFEPYYEQYKELEYLVTHEEDISVALSYMYEKESFEKEHGPEITAYLAAKLQRDNAELDIVSGMLSERNIREYNNLAGEVEARNVMARRDMSIMERRKSLASSTEDVSREEQIVTHKGISAAMVDEKFFDQILDDNKDVLERMKNNPIDHSQDKGYHINIGTDDRPGGVEGEYHLQFTKEIPYVKFEEMMQMAHDMGGSARIMNGSEWVDFYSEDDAVKFGDKIIALNADRIVAERELASEQLSEQRPVREGDNYTLEDILNKDDKFRYMLLSRMQSDVKYFLGNGNRNEPDLWGGNVENHLNVMYKLWDSLPEKPEWLTREQIDVYAKQMGVGRDMDGQKEALVNDVHQLIKEAGLEYSALTPRIPVTVMLVNDEGVEEKKAFSHAIVSKNDIEVFEDRYDAYDGRKGFKLSELPEASQVEVLRVIKEQYGDLDRQVPVHIDKQEVPEYALSAIVNGDFSGIDSEEDSKNIHEFMERKFYKGAEFIPREESASFTSSPAFGLATDCVTVDIVRFASIRELREEQKQISKDLPFPEVVEDARVRLDHALEVAPLDAGREMHMPGNTHFAIRDYEWFDLQEHIKNGGGIPHAYALVNNQEKGIGFLMGRDAMFVPVDKLRQEDLSKLVYAYESAVLYELVKANGAIQFDEPVAFVHTTALGEHIQGSIKEVSIDGDVLRFEGTRQWSDGHTESLKGFGISNGGMESLFNKVIAMNIQKVDVTLSEDKEKVTVKSGEHEQEYTHVHGWTHNDPALIYNNTEIDVFFYDSEKNTVENIENPDNEAGIDGYEGRNGFFLVRTEDYDEAYRQMEEHDREMGIVDGYDNPQSEPTREEMLKRVVEIISLDNQAYSPEEQAIVRDAVTVMLEKYNNDYYQSKVMIPEMVKTYDISDRQELETVVASVVYDIQDDALRRDPDILKGYLPVDMSREDEIGRMVTEAVNYAERIVDYRVNKLYDVVNKKVEDVNKTVTEYNRLSSAKDHSFSLTKHIQSYELTVQGENELALVDGVERNYVTSWMGARELLAHIDTLEQKMKEQFPELKVSKEEKVQDATVLEPKQEESKPAEEKSSKWENFDYSRCRLPEGIKLDRKEVFIDRTGPKAKYFIIAEGYGKSFKKSMYPNDIKAYYLKDDYGRKTPKCTIDQLVAKYFGKQFAEAMSIGSVSEAEHVLLEQKEEKVNVINDKEQKVQAHAESEKSREAEEAANKKAEEAKRREKKEKVPAIILQASLLSGALAASVQHDGFFLNLSGKQSPVLYHDDQAVSAFNALMMGLHADANGYKSYVFTTYDSSKADGCHVKGGESGLPFNWYQWDKYISKFNAHDVITKEAYDQLDPQMKELYSILRTKEERSVFNIDQTNMSEAKADDYKSLMSSVLPVCSVSVSGSVDMKQLIAQSEMKKQEYPDKILLMRHDSQYEVFGSDAADMAKVIDVPVEEVDYDGKAVQKVSVPVDTLEAVLPKVVDAGYHVLFFDDVAEQLSVKGTVSSDEIYRKCDQLVAALEKTDQNVQVNPTFDTQYDVKEGVLRLSNERSVVSGEEMKIALDRINDTYRACVGYTGAEQRLSRSASVMTLPADRQRYELLVQDLAAGVMMMREGLPAKLSADVINDIPFWQRELKESPKMLESIESDVNHAVQVLENIRDGVEVDYSSLRENKSFEALGEQSYSIASEIANSTDIETKKVVLVKDTKHNSVAVILPSGASLEVNNELAGMNKNGYVIALRKEGFDDVRFFNAGGVLGLNQPNEFFADKEVVTAQLKDYTIHEIDGLDFSQELARNGKVDIEQVTITLDDNNNPVLFVKPSEREAFTVYADRNDLNLFVESMKTQNFDAVRESLGQKYYDLVKKYPNLKRDILVPDTEGIDLSRITSVNITKDRAKDNTTIILVAIDGEQQAPVQLSKGQAQHLWLADDIDKYKVSLAAQLFKDKLGIDQGHSEDGQVQFRDDHEGQHVSTDEVPSEEAKEVHEETVEGKRGLGL